MHHRSGPVTVEKKRRTGPGGPSPEGDEDEMSVTELATMAGWFVVGALAWTLVEWILHGQVFHDPKSRNPFAREHALHHATPSYIAGWGLKLLALVVLVVVITAALRPAFGFADAVAGALGFGLMYLGYEALHRTIHRRAPRTAYGRWLRLYHVQHHFHTPRKDFGVTSMLWDRVFGTYAPFDTPLAVPQRLALPWMLDPRTGQLAAKYADDYVLVRRVRDARDSALAAPQ